MAQKISFETTLPFTIEETWEALTDPAAIEQWLMKNDFKPEVGHKFKLREDNPRGWRGFVEGEVLEAQKPFRLSYTWRGDPKQKPQVVTYFLVKDKDGTRLSFEHRGFEGIGGFILSRFILGPGWKKKILKEKLPEVLRFKRAMGDVTSNKTPNTSNGSISPPRHEGTK